MTSNLLHVREVSKTSLRDSLLHFRSKKHVDKRRGTGKFQKWKSFPLGQQSMNLVNALNAHSSRGDMKWTV